MNKPTTPNTPKKHLDGESLMAIFLLILTVFLLLTVIVLTFRACTNEQDKPQGNDGITTPQTPIVPPGQSQQKYIFSSGTLVPLAGEDANTKTISDEIDAYYAILIDAKTGKIVAQKNSELVFSPASMTKVMTLIVACENLTTDDLDRMLPYTHDIHEYVTTGDYFDMDIALPVITESGISCIGDYYTIKDLLYGIGVTSAADCAYMIAKEIAGSEEAFVDMMNAKARELGLTDTQFDNIVGFDSAENVTTARDMAQIMAYAMQCNLIVDILKPRTTSYSVRAHYWDDDGIEQTYGVHFSSSYQSRLKNYPSFSLTGANIEACKTGYTDQSFIVTSAISKSTGARYILVLGDREDGSGDNRATKYKKTMMDMETLFNTFVP